ncbi:MAG: RluA family pseudouridine synthase [Gallionellaceae bacterium]|nr:RluA family pseudouridine synthase [Gallionellaceae bacterium]
MKDLGKESVNFTEIGEDAAGQRIDNFLSRHLKGVPKSHIYRILRSGEVRVNKKRVDQTCRLQLGDLVRIPPVRLAERAETERVPVAEFPVLYEDDALLAINKPAGVAVHGGSGVSFGVIEQLRASRSDARLLELAHRLDRETSGVLLLAKKRSALVGLHEQLRDGKTDKRYLALALGQWKNAKQHVRLPLHKFTRPDGERRVMVREDGLESHTVFALQRAYGEFSLLEAQLKTGRTHQIRVHLAHLGYPIAGDEKYGDFARNKELAKQGLKRMFLHAYAIGFSHPLTGEALRVTAELPRDLERFLVRLSDSS